MFEEQQIFRRKAIGAGVTEFVPKQEAAVIPLNSKLPFHDLWIWNDVVETDSGVLTSYSSLGRVEFLNGSRVVATLRADRASGFSFGFDWNDQPDRFIRYHRGTIKTAGGQHAMHWGGNIGAIVAPLRVVVKATQVKMIVEQLNNNDGANGINFICGIRVLSQETRV